MKLKLIFLALLLCPLAFAQGVKQQFGTTNTGPVLTNIIRHLADSVPFNSSAGLIAEGSSLNLPATGLYKYLTNISGWSNFGAMTNLAVTGSHLSDLVTRWPQSATAISNMKSAGITNLYFLIEIGANDIGDPTTVPATYFTTWSNYIARAQASNCTVIAFTIMPQDVGYVPTTPQTNWALINQYIRMSRLPDYLVDWSRLLPNPTDTQWFIDGVHLTAAGYTRAASAVDAVLRGPIRQKLQSIEQPDFSTNLFVFSPSSGALNGVFNDKRWEVLSPAPTIRFNDENVLTNSGGFEWYTVNTFEGSMTLQPNTAEMAISIGRAPAWGGHLLFITDTAEKMRLTSTGLGIGITPTTLLDVNGIFTLRNTLNVPNEGVITFDGGIAAFDVLAASGKALSLGANATYDQIVIDLNGNMGIGRTGVNAKLDVNGDIRALTTITATNSFMLPTNYVASNFVPVAGMVKICASNGVLWKVTQLTTNLLSANTP